ncbi:hypothetical protein AMJ87_03045 [candidate division WOR_3 bacterium SM23_60]|uniref:Uncharacterized protein n=1 Tax=candidate division WOR_3 bacterium SM23_60 TaxID=1703780 RepID=A0A0S8GJ48_UNCW3|nr:MAG: hypothetical protein AMJ87_03045 [candidate division WOR_3 bacterium SM23_60]
MLLFERASASREVPLRWFSIRALDRLEATLEQYYAWCFSDCRTVVYTLAVAVCKRDLVTKIGVDTETD